MPNQLIDVFRGEAYTTAFNKNVEGCPEGSLLTQFHKFLFTLSNSDGASKDVTTKGLCDLTTVEVVDYDNRTRVNNIKISDLLAIASEESGINWFALNFATLVQSIASTDDTVVTVVVPIKSRIEKLQNEFDCVRPCISELKNIRLITSGATFETYFAITAVAYYLYLEYSQDMIIGYKKYINDYITTDLQLTMPSHRYMSLAMNQLETVDSAFNIDRFQINDDDIFRNITVDTLALIMDGHYPMLSVTSTNTDIRDNYVWFIGTPKMLKNIPLMRIFARFTDSGSSYNNSGLIFTHREGTGYGDFVAKNPELREVGNMTTKVSTAKTPSRNLGEADIRNLPIKLRRNPGRLTADQHAQYSKIAAYFTSGKKS